MEVFCCTLALPTLVIFLYPGYVFVVLKLGPDCTYQRVVYPPPAPHSPEIALLWVNSAFVQMLLLVKKYPSLSHIFFPR